MLIIALYLILIFFALAQIRVFVISGLSFILKRRRRKLSSPFYWPASDMTWPSVVVQLPVYREHKVLDRLLSSVVKMEYPRGRISVQVLDDSEEKEASLAEEIVNKYRDGSIRIEYIHRNCRTGYKSGALNYGNRQANGDLVAIFDADFIPKPNFLLKTVPLFQNEQVGAVHTRWNHLNDFESPLTMMQAAILDSLFCFENAIRQSMGESSMYLGTSGVWRKCVIDELGGWREAPFTDDGLDLSFRAQIAGWTVAFVDEPLSDSELPDTYLAYKSQQRRWARAALRLFLDYWQQAFQRPRGIGIRFLELSLLHLVLSMPCLLLSALLTGLYIALGLPRSGLWLGAQIGLMVSLVLFPPTQEVLLSQILLYRDWPRRCLLVLRAIPIGIGVSVSILAGFWDTLDHSKIEFVTTPKQGSEAVIRSSQKRWVQNAAQIATLEILMGILTLIALILAVVRGYPESWFLLLSLTSAFLISGWTSLHEISQKLTIALQTSAKR